MTSLLKDVVRVGTATRALSLNRTDLAGKTGTTNENVDAWFCGYNAATGRRGVDRLRPAEDARRQRDGRQRGASRSGFRTWRRRSRARRRPTGRCPKASSRCRSTPKPACATTSATITEYFLAEFPPRRRDDSFDPEQVRQGHTRPALLGASMAVSRAPPRPQRTASASHRDRLRIAQVAARLIAEHGLTDWTLAKRKAAAAAAAARLDGAAARTTRSKPRSTDAPRRCSAATPTSRALRRQRQRGARWMRRLAPWDPLLVGGVAAGWATEHSDVRLELVADDPKAVEMDLAGRRRHATRRCPRAHADAAHTFAIDRRGGAIRLAIVSPAQRRNRPRRSEEPRLSADALAALIAEEASAQSGSTGRPARYGQFDSARRRDPPCGGEREVGEDRVGAGALEAGQRLEHARALVEPAVLRAPPSASRIRRTPGRPTVGAPNASFTRRTMSRYGMPGFTITMSAPSVEIEPRPRAAPRPSSPDPSGRCTCCRSPRLPAEPTASRNGP